jgi:hypothetical protein
MVDIIWFCRGWTGWGAGSGCTGWELAWEASWRVLRRREAPQLGQVSGLPAMG